MTHPIRSDADHNAALAGIEALWDATPDTAEHDECEILAILVAAYADEPKAA